MLTAETFAELESRLRKPKLDRWLDLDLRRSLLRDLSAAALWVTLAADLAARRFCRDAHDNKFVHAAVAAGAPWIISGDKDLLAMAPIPGLRVLTPTDAMAEAILGGQ